MLCLLLLNLMQMICCSSLLKLFILYASQLYDAYSSARPCGTCYNMYAESLEMHIKLKAKFTVLLCVTVFEKLNREFRRIETHFSDRTGQLADTAF